MAQNIPDDRILDLAARWAMEGKDISIPDLAAELDVAKGTLYRKWPDRTALMDRLVSTGRIPAQLAKSGESREKILTGLGGLLRHQSLAAITLEKVAAESGVGVATVYRIFKDRRTLLRAFMAERTPRRLVAGESHPTRTGKEALLELTCSSLLFLREYPSLFPFGPSVDEETRELLSEVREGPISVRGQIARIIDAHVPDPGGRVKQIYMGILLAVAWSTPGDLDQDAREVVDTFWKGVSK